MCMIVYRMCNVYVTSHRTVRNVYAYPIHTVYTTYGRRFIPVCIIYTKYMLQTLIHRITILILTTRERCGRNTHGVGSWINMVRDIEIDFVF